MHIEADRVRDEILEIGGGQTAHEAAWSKNLAPGVTGRIYRKMFGRVRNVLLTGGSVVVDGCFAKRWQRTAARTHAQQYDTNFLFVECRAPRSVLEQRLRARSSAAGVPDSAWLTLLDRIEGNWEPVSELLADEYMAVDSANPLASIVGDVVARLRGSKLLAATEDLT